MRLLLRCCGTLRSSFFNRTFSSSSDPARIQNKEDGISEAMKKYLKETDEYEEAVEKQQQLYKEGVESLALMINKDPAHMTENDIKEAVAYLFPSSLLSQRGRPKLVPPEGSHPARKSLQCSLDGRPLQSLFYTKKPNYFGIMSKAAAILYELEEKEDRNLRRGIKSTKFPKLKLVGTEWITLKELQHVTLEKLTEADFTHMMTLFERLIKHPLSFLATDFVSQYRIRRFVSETATAPPQVQTDAVTGRKFAQAYGQRKRAFAEVSLWLDGTGKITVNGERLLTAFPDIGDREQLLTPLIFARQLGKLDVELQTTGDGSSATSGAARLAIARALSSVIDEQTVERMRQGGLLTPDMRFGEKKKGGLHGARKRFIWKRR